MGGAFAAGLAAAGLLAVAAPAGATITPLTPHTNAQLSEAIRLTLAGGNFPVQTPSFYVGPSKQTSVPPNGNPVGIGDNTGAMPFPIDGQNYLALSTGDASVADKAGAIPSNDDGGGPITMERGSSALDLTVIVLPFASPSDPTGKPLPACLSFDYRFLSGEYPARVASDDAFIAELDTTTWTTTPGLSAPNDFAVDGAGGPITARAGAPASMSPAEAAGTPYGAATAPLRAQTFVPASATTHRLFLSIFDHGDRANDSTVFLDGFALVQVASQANCPSGSTGLGPALAITAPTVSATVDTQTPTLTGTADANADPTVTVRIYNGAVATGAPVQTLTAPRSGTTWSVRANALAPGQYTAQATQALTGINGVSAPATFTVATPPQSAPSQQPPVGDKDHDGIPDDVDTSDGSQPPVPGKTFDARVVSGQVFVKYPPGKGPRAVKPLKGFVPLNGAVNLPMGSQLDTRAGRVAVTSAHDTGAVKTQTADFYDGIFAVKQATPKTKPKKPAVLITDLVLKGEPLRSECAPLKGAAAATATKKKKGAKSVLGQLWGSGKGRFRTSGKYSSATVRGTIWLTQDRCDGTLTTVKRGVVSVRDFKRHKTVTVKAGHSYLARAQRAAGKAARRK